VVASSSLRKSDPEKTGLGVLIKVERAEDPLLGHVFVHVVDAADATDRVRQAALGVVDRHVRQSVPTGGFEALTG
jgi:hypothetical protein